MPGNRRTLPPLRWLPFLALVAFLALPSGLGQVPPPPEPDLGPVSDVVDEAAGSIIVPAVAQGYRLLGQNITREDVRIKVDANFTKGDVGVLGLLIGSGSIEIQAHVKARLEVRVISVDRVRQAVEAAGFQFNATFGNLSFLSGVYLPAEVFRASLTAEALAQFQQAEEAAIAQFLARTVPDMVLLELRMDWSHTLPFEAFSDTALEEPPITVEVDLVAEYRTIESIPSLLGAYLESSGDDAENATKAEDSYVDRLREENGDPLTARDFFAAAAYTQLLNLSMQPGWSLDLNLSVPRGYEFTYVNRDVEQQSAQRLAIHVDALEKDAAVQEVFLASITHPRGVALALFVATWFVAFVVATPLRLAYGRWRIPRLARGVPFPRKPHP